MADSIPTRLRLGPGDKDALLAYWQFFEPIAKQVNDDLRESLLALPEWAPLMRAMSATEAADQHARTLAQQRAAIVDGNWAPYLHDLRAQGSRYARMGVSFLAWYDVIAIYREAIRRRIAPLMREDPERAARVGDGMTRMIDIAMGHLGEAYLGAKEQIIQTQEEAIRSLSLPILQVKDRVLIVPVVGNLDNARARDLTEKLLAAIRERRASGVVIDVTGVPDVDTATANYLVRTCDAARLMGAEVAITGISADMARALVTLGARLPRTRTLGDLQEGLDVVTAT